MSGTSREMTAEVKLVGEVLKAKGLSIPDYQRPYKWSLKHVNQLVDDLIFHMEKGVSSYRVGTVVLHKEPKEGDPKTLNIVDGQQRLITFSLILHFLKAEDENKGFLAWMEKKEDGNKKSSHLLNHHISCFNLQNNYAAIKQKLFAYDGKEKLSTFILEQCEFVVVTLTDISEAFQFFDSQNARGKGLEPYDLLKAFHLREMADESENVKRQCVDAWEASIENKRLKPLFNDYLYRIRRWLRSESGLNFTNDDIDVFKGVALNKDKYRYPHVQPYRMLEAFFAGNAQVISAWEGMPSFPFQVNQTIINGKRFFDYVTHYESLLESVKDQKDGIFKMLDTYDGYDRVGDQYTRNLFNAVLLCFIDRFGAEHLDSATRVCFLWAYAIRFHKYSVKKVTMDNKGQERFLRQIQYANHPSEITNMPLHLPLEKDVKKQGKVLYAKYNTYLEAKHAEE